MVGFFAEGLVEGVVFEEFAEASSDGGGLRGFEEEAAAFGGELCKGAARGADAGAAEAEGFDDGEAEAFFEGGDDGEAASGVELAEVCV